MALIISIVFLIGYCVIILEEFLKQNKAAAALLTAGFCWSIILIAGGAGRFAAELGPQTGKAAEVLFFLLPAMTIVELMESNNCFDILSGLIKTGHPVKLLWIICLSAFFLSSILDNLTAAVVMIMMARKFSKDKSLTMLYSGAIVIAVNAGGAWSPIGDITTVMLWISGRITAWNVMRSLFLPCIACIAVPVLFLSRTLKKHNAGGVSKTGGQIKAGRPAAQGESLAVLLSGFLLLSSVPFLKSFLNIPPYMGMLSALGILWVLTEFMHKNKPEEERSSRSVPSALKRIDFTTLIFFLGILLSVSSLETAGALGNLAAFIDSLTGSKSLAAVILGLFSSVIDNVPLTAAVIGMYPVQSVHIDNTFWLLVSYCAGTGGSALIIGSAAGAAMMGMEKITFFTYLKKFGFLSLAGYFSGIIVFFIQESLLKL